MSLEFEKFLKQYNTTGSEKADGYDKNSLLALSEHERVMAFDLLLSEIPWSIEWLFVLNQDRALSVAKTEEIRLRTDPYADAYLLQEQIIEHSGDLTYQEHMLEDYFHYIDSKKPLVIDTVGRTPTNQAVLDFLKQVILVETNDSAVKRASRLILQAGKFSRNTDSNRKVYERLMNDLTSQDIATKKRVLSEVGNKI